VESWSVVSDARVVLNSVMKRGLDPAWEREERYKTEVLTTGKELFAELQSQTSSGLQGAEDHVDESTSSDPLSGMEVLEGEGASVSCPLCSHGSLVLSGGDLRCTSCDMHSSMMDESLPLEVVSEMLNEARDRHKSSGCSAEASFQVREDYGPSLLFLCCEACGWRELGF